MMEGKTKFCWLHGVFRSGVHRALSDSKRSIYYRRTFRQALVIVSVIATSTLVVAAYLSDGKTQSYTVGVALALTIVLYMLLRKSCRLIAESPAELLDERLLEIRNQAYYVAYQMLAFSVGLLVSFIWMASRFDVRLLQPNQLTPLVLAFVMLGALLPNMIVAWMLPSEEQL